ALVESRIQSGPYKTYRRVLAEVGGELASFLGVGPEAVEDAFLADSITRWEPFADTVPALAKLEQRYRLAIVSNIDDDLISASLHKLRADFDPVVTAEQVGSYKPSRDNFLAAIERAGVEKDRILHVAQSLYHDIQPANELGLSNVWVNRRKGKPGAGATFPADASPTMEVPDLATLASIACQ
ncbi:MAG: HAD-IA family hydrolase, partial [Candidatus Latescibacterota bacterium]